MDTQGLGPRRAALKLINGVVLDHRLMSEILPRITAPLEGDEAARAQRLAMQTFKMLDRADRLLKKHMNKQPVPPVMNILRLGTVEICAEGAPAHGVVNAMVALAGENKKTSTMGGLVNAVLRKVAETGPTEWGKSAVPMLPKWLRGPLMDDYGQKVISGLETVFAAPVPLDLTAKGDAAALAEKLGGTLLPTGSVRLADPGRVTGLAGYGAGLWWVQDAAAALPARILNAQVGESVLDMCAAPGGKTMQLAAAGADVTALDVSENRMARVRENLTRTGLKAKTVVGDALEFEGGPFDAILLDAPCTATGTIRRHPDLPYAKDGSDFPSLFELQEYMIDRALGLLKPGGRLIYCTCSLLIDEGEEQVRDALTRHPDLIVDRDALSVPGVEAEWIGDEGGLRIMPHVWADRGGIDGFYIACLRKPA